VSKTFTKLFVNLRTVFLKANSWLQKIDIISQVKIKMKDPDG